jgi:sulfite exporter TauE/SafE
MVKKLIGYIIALIGLAGLAISIIPQLENALKLPAPLTGLTVTIISIALILIGIFLIMKNSKAKQAAEVPIFQGAGKKRTVVGYQRH